MGKKLNILGSSSVRVFTKDGFGFVSSSELDRVPIICPDSNASSVVLHSKLSIVLCFQDYKHEIRHWPD